MKAVRISFLHMVAFLRRDMMLFAACISPFFIGPLFRFGIPALERVMTGYFVRPAILAPYYEIFDMFFSVLAPTMFCYVAAMVVLEERDDHMTKYLEVTPLGKTGYLVSRLGLPCAAAFGITGCLLPLFNLSHLQAGMAIYLTLTGALQGLVITLLVITLSTNKLEGMAVTKLSGIMFLGIMIPYFVPRRIQYILSFLPSFWVGRAVYQGRSLEMALSIIMSLAWMGVLLKNNTK